MRTTADTQTFMSVESTPRDIETPAEARRRRWRQSTVLAFLAAAAVGLLGGMIGLGGAEFRLPLLIGLFGFVALQAVILNKAMSLAVVLTALAARLVAVPYQWGQLAPSRRASWG
jgi:uncharacterized protein